MKDTTERLKDLASALLRAGSEHGIPNSFALLELDSYGAGGAMSVGKLGKHNLPELNEALAENGLTSAYANGRFFLSVATATAKSPRSPKKPPLGIMPRWRYEELQREARLNEIDAAVARYEAVAKPVPPEWVTERADLVAAAREARIRRAAASCPNCTATEFCMSHAIELRPQYAPTGKFQ